MHLRETQGQLRVRPRCSGPSAHVSGGGSTCGSATIHARFEGTPPFKVRWSDGAQLETSAFDVDRTVTVSGSYSIDHFEDANCDGSSSGGATVEILGAPGAVVSMNPKPVSAAVGGELQLSFTAATSCTLLSALGNVIPQPVCDGTGSQRLSYPRDRDTPGNETITLRVNGQCGQNTATASFFICDYLALTKTVQSETICEGDTFTFTIVASSEGANPGSSQATSAGPPFSDYRVYKCSLPQDQCTLDKFALVQAGSSNTFSTTTAGWYIASMTDRLGCPSRLGPAGRIVTIKKCP